MRKLVFMGFYVCPRCLTAFDLSDVGRAREEWSVHRVLCEDEVGGWGDVPQTSEAYIARCRELVALRTGPLALLDCRTDV